MKYHIWAQLIPDSLLRARRVRSDGFIEILMHNLQTHVLTPIGEIDDLD